MFGIFKSKETDHKEEQVAEIGSTLFQQIESARDKAKNGIIGEKEFNDRLNRMYTAGYLIGYVDVYLSKMFDDDVSRHKNAERIFEDMFPGSGITFVRAKMSFRQKGATLSSDSNNFAEITAECNEFDLGICAAREDVAFFQKDKQKLPSKLEDFLLIGEI